MKVRLEDGATRDITRMSVCVQPGTWRDVPVPPGDHVIADLREGRRLMRWIWIAASIAVAVLAAAVWRRFAT